MDVLLRGRTWKEVGGADGATGESKYIIMKWAGLTVLQERVNT